LEEARKAVEEGGNPQWALQLTDLILDSGICQAVRTFISREKRSKNNPNPHTLLFILNRQQPSVARDEGP
jgi:hypothetical protein